MAHLLISNNKIVNSIVLDGESDYTPPEGQTLVEYSGPFDIGWAWDGSKAVAPAPPATAKQTKAGKPNVIAR
jgi:hypothetical protein